MSNSDIWSSSTQEDEKTEIERVERAQNVIRWQIVEELSKHPRALLQGWGPEQEEAVDNAVAFVKNKYPELEYSGSGCCPGEPMEAYAEAVAYKLMEIIRYAPNATKPELYSILKKIEEKELKEAEDLLNEIYKEWKEKQ